MTGIIAGVVATGNLGISASNPNATANQAQFVITARQTVSLEAGDVAVLENNAHVPVVRVQRLTGALADMQLFILLDDSTRSSSLGTQLPELKKFVEALPTTTQVAIGYMRNGTFGPAQAFTADHKKAAAALRLPMAGAGDNASPYFALSDLAKHWPSKQSTGRRAVLMLTDGVDPYYGTAIMDDPYVDTAIHDALKQGVMVYSIYLRGAGRYDRGSWVTTIAQSRLGEVAQETGGYTYFLGLSDPVTIAPYLSDFEDRLQNQYQVTIEATHQKGVQPIKVRTEPSDLKIEAPTRIYVR
jgi:hypothetical protein